MKFRNIIISAILLSSGISLPAQEFAPVQHQTSGRYIKALNMFELQNYTGALQLFEDLYSENSSTSYYEQSNTAYYLALCHQLVGDSYLAEIYFNDFLHKYPENLHNNEAMFSLAQIQFANKSYRTALETFNKIDIQKINNSYADEYYYKKGYCYLKTNKREDAKASFEKAITSKSEYGMAALYFYGVIAYDESDYDTALNCFSQLTNDATFGEQAEQYMIRIYSIKKQYNNILSEYDKYQQVSNKKDNTENIKIFADAFYQDGNFEKAIELYESVKNNLSPEENYQLGFSYFSIDDFANAIPYFEDAVAENDTLNQNALFHIGVCQLRTGNKNFAASSFREAAKIDINKDIATNALFNYVKIVYETGFDPYNEAMSNLQQFIADNPKSEKIDEAYSYLAKLFLSTNNYKQALEAINKLEVLNKDLKSAYQKINYSSAIENFKAKKYTNAISLFEKSKKYQMDAVIAAEATFWIGESYYRQNKYKDAIKAFKSMAGMSGAKKSPYYTASLYSTGYCYFKDKNYSEALTYFNQFINSGNKSSQMLADAYNRIGDCYFILQQHDNAIKSYEKAVTYKGNRSDYSLYYKATALGAKNKLTEKANTLKEIVAMPHETLMRSTALFELANTYTLSNKNAEAINTYKQFINEYPKNNLIVKAKQKLGLLYYNQNNNAEAISIFKDIVSKYPGTSESVESLNILKNIYVEEGKVDDYLDFVNNTAHIKTSASEADSLSYSSAQKLYLSGKYDKAKDACASYLKKYPNGVYKTECNFYLGDCYFQEKNYNEALKYFVNVYQSGGSIYTENARLKSALIQQYNKNYAEAAKLFEQVVANAEYDYIIQEANVELMRCYHKLNNYNKLSTLSEKVANAPVYDEEIKKEAKYYNAISLMKLRQTDKAYTKLAEIAAGNYGEMSAEAKYYCCLIKYEKAEYEDAEKQTFELVQNYGSYDYWVAKGFILLADIYTMTGNEFQARQTLQSIIDNYKGNDLKEEAQSKLNQLNKDENEQ